MALRSSVVCVCLMVAFAGCERPATQVVQKPAQPAVVPAPPTPLDVKKAELGGTTWDPQWDAVVEKALPADMLDDKTARAVRVYCPRFTQETEAQKREFWAYMFQAIAAAEAGLNPTADVHHLQAPVNVVDPVTKRPARQEGLMQVKYEDAQRYGCDFDWEKDRTLPVKDPGRTILSPENNLGCGVKIMENQIVTQGKPLVSRTSYWATLQPGTAGFRVFAKQMTNVPAACGLRVRSVPRRRTEIASR
ncbi:transglycosylase SLT domain-containing protein [Granulicella sp. L46]|uniref:transglycosylase SLT domain-containing protein n=1 Tax=Granulicella sp. L46 TaxID=1641865 RepID=UPI00131D380D|nr:transglycosylase SLT domain-containing protein [Granulicella sp. L46]